MKSKILLIIFTFFFNQILIAENIKISAKNITIDKNTQSTMTIITSNGNNNETTELSNSL